MVRKPFSGPRPPLVSISESLSGLFSSMNSSIAAFEAVARRRVDRRACDTPSWSVEGTLEKRFGKAKLEAFKVKSRTLIGDEAFDRWMEARERIKPKRPPAGPEILEAT